MEERWKAYEIHGLVTGRNGDPLPHARVVAWWKQIRGRTEVAAGSTSERGNYVLRFRLREDIPQPVLMVVEALSEFLDAPLSSPLTQLQQKLEIDLTFEPRDQSEWAKMVRALEPLLDGLRLDELAEDSTHQDLTFLSKELNQSTEALMRVAVSARMGAAFKLSPAVFYAFLRQRVPSALPSPLLDASQNFTLIGPLVQNIASMIFSLSAQIQTQALTSAIALDYIGPQYTKSIQEIVSQLQAHRAADLLTQPFLVGSTTLAQLLDVAALPAVKQQVFAQTLATNTQSMRNFWRTLGSGKNGLTATEASSIERTLSIGAFVKNYAPLVQGLMQGFIAGTYKSLSDLATLSKQDWVQMVTKTGAPPSIDVAGDQNSAEVFASVVYTRVTRAYPTAALSARIPEIGIIAQEQQQPLVQFFQNNPDLELVKDNIPVYLAAQGDKAFANIGKEAQAAVIANARSLQRVLRVSPDTDVAQTILSLGFTSAMSIATMGQQQFFHKATAAGLTKPEANQAYQAATQRYTAVVSVYLQLNRDSLGVWPKAMGSLDTVKDAMVNATQVDPTLSTLFGSEDYCATDDCTSILSPAAYLCDLLMWLRGRPAGAQSVLDVLDGRRSDIRHLLLNCPNTDTELPYIDLVIELLADRISPPTDPTSTINPPWKQASAEITSAQLIAAPEYFNQDAFVQLSQASYPQSLPYSTGLDGLRTYLKQWNLPLWQLRQALLPLGGATIPQQAAVAAERFGMSAHAEDLVANVDFVTAAVAWNTANPSTDLVVVPAFLQASSLTYEQLLELLDVAWVQGGLNVAIQGIDDTCMTSSQTLTPSPLDAGFLDRAHRFLRLWLASGYKMWELDLLLNAMDVLSVPPIPLGTLNEAALIAMLAFQQLLDRTSLPVDALLAFYKNIDTATHRDPNGTTTISLYDQIFLNPTVTWIAPDPDMAAVATGGTIGDPILSDHLKAIQPALGISAADTAALFALTDNTLTLTNLSLLYRVNALAIAARLSISNLLSIAVLLNPTAADTAAAVAELLASPAATLVFLAEAKTIAQAGLTLDALKYLLTPPSSTVDGGWTTTTQMTQTDIASTLVSVQQAVASVLSAMTTLSAPIDNVQTQVTVVNGSDFPMPNFSVVIGSEILLVTSVSGVNNTVWTVSRGQQGTSGTAADSGATVAPTGADILGGIIAAVAARAHTASGAGLANDVSAVILNTLLIPETTSTLLSVLSDPTFTGSTSPMTQASFPSQFLAIQLFDKVAVLVRGLHFVAADLSWLISNASVYGGLDFAKLPVTAQPQLSLGPLLNTLLMIKLARLWLAAPPSSSVQSLYDVISSIATGTLDNIAKVQTALANITGWPLTDIEAFAPSLALTFPVSYTQPATYDALRTLEAMSSAVTASGGGLATPSTQLAAGIDAGITSITVTSNIGFPAPGFYVYIGAEILLVTGVSGSDNTIWQVSRAQEGTTAVAAVAGATVTQTLGAQIVSWGAVPQDEMSAQNLAASALSTLKAQQASNDAWMTLAPSLMNPIRENRSAALQAFLTAQRDGSGNLIYPDANSLFNYFLIDVQMSSCQVTSRMVQAYIAVQIFVERCMLGLEAPTVVVDPSVDDAWDQWQWMSRYRVWEANRELFFYPENWLIESQRPNRTETYQSFEQEVRQGESTTDYLETTVLNYIDRLDGLAHLLVTGTCEDPLTGTIYVVARTLADPPTFYLRTYASGAWTGWTAISISIKAHQVIPAMYRGRITLFWMDVKVSNEPSQPVPAAQASSEPPSQDVERYVTIGLYFSTFRNDAWSAAQTSKGKLFDKPLLSSQTVSNAYAVEALYTLKVQQAPSTPGYGSNLWLDVFRFGDYDAGIIALAERFDAYAATLETTASNPTTSAADAASEQSEADAFESTAAQLEALATQPNAVHIGRAVFDGRFNDLELNNLGIAIYGADEQLYTWAQQTYGPDAQPLLPLVAPDPDLLGEPGLTPRAGTLSTQPANAGGGANQSIALNFTSAGALEQGVGPLLSTAQLPFRVVGPDTDLNFDPASYFFFQDNRRSYWVESQKSYWTGSMASPVSPSDPNSVTYQLSYVFHPFYHPFTRLFWNQLSAGGFDLLYDPNLQQNPDQIDPSGAEKFSFQSNYNPVISRVWWDHDDVTGADRQYLDFNYNTPFSVYNWELFYHVPLYIAQLLSQNQQFEDAQSWFHYIFNPTRQSADPIPGRFWIPKPLHNLSTGDIVNQQINNLLLKVNQGDLDSVNQVKSWRQDPLNPFALADLRMGVPYMKSTVMSYLDNLIAWGDNLFASESREALSEATLLYVVASETLGPQPVMVTPPPTADQSFDQLSLSLDAFANAMVEIENTIGGTGGSGSGTGSGSGSIPTASAFYFKIPSNPKLLGYWDTVADRLYKLRHCQSLTGAPLQLALFDAPIDPGLLIAAQAAGVDLSSVLTDLGASLPNYRFTSLYSQALDFVNAVRAYGTSLQAALEKSDAGTLSLLQQTLQQQLLSDGSLVQDWMVQRAQTEIDAVTETLALAQQKHTFNTTQVYTNANEQTADELNKTLLGYQIAEAVAYGLAGLAVGFPDFIVGVAGFGGTPSAGAKEGSSNAAQASKYGALFASSTVKAIAQSSRNAAAYARYDRRNDVWKENAAEAQIQIKQATAQLAAANLALQIAQQNQTLHQEQIENLQKQIDFLTNKFTSNSLYDWMVSSLSATYFQSYQLAYQMCKQVERCYQYELGIKNSSFIQFGYWDSLHKGLLAGETLNHDLRRMQSSYLQQNARRYELSRYVSLSLLDAGNLETPGLLQRLLTNGWCDFTLPESLFDNDYPGHYNRRLTRVSVTVVYPSPGKFDNIKATLTLVSNKVRISTAAAVDGSDYAENPVGSDPRFLYNYAAVPQKIAMGNAQDDPGLFVTAIASNIADQRYLPFENAGAISSWHLEMPQINNEIDLSTVGDVVLHLYYTALDGGTGLQQAVAANNVAQLPTSGIRVFSAQNDFVAAAPTVDNPYPITPWQALVASPKSLFNATALQTDGSPRWEVFNNTPIVNPDQMLTVTLLASKFPAWTRGKTISITSLTMLVAGWVPGDFIVQPQSPLPSASVTMTPAMAGSEPNVCSATITMPPNTPIGTWSFKIKQASAADFHSLNKNVLGDVVLVVNYEAS